MKKISLCAAVLCCICLLFSACSSDERAGYKTFAEEMAKIDERYYFEYFDMFIYEHTYHVYLSLVSENDILLSMKLSDSGDIDEITVTAEKEKIKSDGEREAYKDFVFAVIDCFADLDEDESKELYKKLSIDSTGEYYSNLYETYSSLRYNFVFSSNSEYINFSCEYYEIMENTQ